MHRGPMPDSAGTFREPETELYHCYGCGQKTAKANAWDSSDGAYTDYKYTCADPKCGKVRWVDGDDG